MLTKQVNSNKCNFFQIFKTCSSLSNLSQYQKAAKNKTAASKIDADPNLITGMAPKLGNALLTALSHSKHQSSTETFSGYCHIPLEDTA